MKLDMKSLGVGALAGGGVVALVMAATGLMTRDAQQAETSVNVTGIGSITTKAVGREDFATLLGKMFADPQIKPQAIAWLESHAQLYATNANTLPDAIARDACESFPSGVTPEALAAKQRCADRENVRKFRQLASDHKPPFHYVGELGRMGVPSGSAYQPNPGFANACRPGDFYGKRLQVATPDGATAIEVTASGSYVCTQAIPTPDIQLSPDDAIKLFSNRALAKTEEVVIVPLE